MPPVAPTNNQAATTDYGTAYNEFGNEYDPQVAQINTQLAALPGQQQQQQSLLDQAKANAFTNNALTSNARGIMYSGYTPAKNTDYTTNTYNPSVQKLNTDFQNQTQTLQQKITDINQQRANDANTLVQNTQQAQAQAAAEALKVQQSAAKSASSKSSSTAKAALPTQIANQIRANLAQVTGKDGYVSPEDYAQAYIDWINNGQSASSFNTNFASFKNKANGYYDYAITEAIKRGS